MNKTHPCSTLVFGLCPDTDSELSASDGTTARNLWWSGIIINTESAQCGKLRVRSVPLIDFVAHPLLESQ